MVASEPRVVGQSIARVDAIERVTGKAVYGPDLALPGTLHCKILRSPYAHARIKSINVAKALKVPGVKAIVTGADLQSFNVGPVRLGGEVAVEARYLRQFFLAEDRVLFHGHPVAAVAATSTHIAEEAVGLIEVDYEPLPAALDILEAMKPGAPIIHSQLRTRSLSGPGTEETNVAVHAEVGRGDVNRGFAASEVVLEREYHVGMAHHGYLEPQACTVAVIQDQIVVYTTTQGSFRLKDQMATLLNAPLNKVKVVPLEIGGGFGGKAMTVPELPTALLALKTGLPVRTVMSRDEVFRATGPAPDAYAKIKIGAKRNGEVTAFEGRWVFNAGCLPGNALYVNNVLVAGLSPYKFPNLKADGFDVITNKPRSQGYRAPGMPEGVFAIESILDELAVELKMDAIDLRIKNVTGDGEPMTDGIPLPVTHLREVLEEVKRHPAWSSPVPPGRGRGVALGMRREGSGTSSAQVTLNGDGTVSVVMGSVDLTGTRTTMAQLAAEALGLEASEVSVKMGDTDSVGYTDSTVGSRTAYVTGVAVTNAVADLIGQLKRLAAQRFRAKPEEVDYKDRTFFVRENPEQKTTLAELAAANTGKGAGAIIGRGVAIGLKPVTSTGVQIAEVAVDRETGSVRVLKYTAFQDPGVAINPMAVEGQVQGAVAQGVGWALWEEYRWDDKGVMRNPTFLDYRMPTALDLPRIDAVFVGGPAPESPGGVRGTGEVPIIPTIAVVGNAVHAATGVRIRQAPMTPENVFGALRGRATKQ